MAKPQKHIGPPNQLMFIGAALLKARKASGYTQVELAEELGTTHSAVCQYEKNRRRPTLDKLVELALILEVTTDELLGLE